MQLFYYTSVAVSLQIMGSKGIKPIGSIPVIRNVLEIYYVETGEQHLESCRISNGLFDHYSGGTGGSYMDFRERYRRKDILLR